MPLHKGLEAREGYVRTLTQGSPMGHLWVTFSCYGIATIAEGERSPESGFSHQVLTTNGVEKSEGDVRDADKPSHASNGLYIGD